MGNNSSGNSAGGVLVAFLSGMALGAVTAFLLAPQTGRESRETISRLARRAGDDLRDLSDKATDTWDEVVTKGREFLDEAGTIVKDAVDAGREAMHQDRPASAERPNLPS